MQKNFNPTLPPEIEAQLTRLQAHEAILRQLIDLEYYPPRELIFWLGSAIISISREEYFRNRPDSREALEMLHHFYHGTYQLIRHLEKYPVQT